MARVTIADRIMKVNNDATGGWVSKAGTLGSLGGVGLMLGLERGEHTTETPLEEGTQCLTLTRSGHGQSAFSPSPQ